jgi:hypothetical protein
MGAGLLFGVGAAALGIFAATRPLLGVAVYAVAATASVVLWYTTDPGAPDGEDIRRSSPADSTLTGLGLASAVFFPGLVAADGLGYYSWSEFTTGIAMTVAGVFVVFGVVSLWWLARGPER